MRTILALLAACAALATGPAWAADKSPGMDMHGMDMPGMKSMPATTRAFTEGHRFRIDLLTVPAPLPLQKYFELQLAVFDGRHPARRLTDASIKVSAGMACRARRWSRRMRAGTSCAACTYICRVPGRCACTFARAGTAGRRI
jgi:hypothetical protein